MPHHRLLWKLYATYLGVILLCTLAVGVNAALWARPFYRHETSVELEEKARMIEPEIAAAILAEGADVQQLVAGFGRRSGTRITVIDPAGDVLADSEEAPAAMGDHSDRDEIREALAGRRGQSTRTSPTLGVEMMYVAVPLKHDGRLLGVLRAAVPLTEIEQALAEVSRKVVIGIAVVAGLASLVALAVSRWISAPLEQMRRGAERFARGDFNRKLPAQETAEFAGLAASLNAMADQLDERIRTTTRQQRELAAVLSSMSEGVLALDSGNRIISMNDSAARMLGIETAIFRGSTLAEVVRQADLQNFVAGVRASGEEAEAETVVDDADTQRRIRLHGSPISDADNRRIGVLVVMRDVTRLERLERVRSDFVANVSHELRTPITSIRGFLETLNEGAIDEPETARRFLGIMLRQAERLRAIIDDLLSLSRIEQDSGGEHVEMVLADVRPVLEAAVADTRERARERGVAVQLDCPADLRAALNARLVEQAVVNLLDNAIKYSEPGGEVAVAAEATGDWLEVRVADHGCGIPPEHLPRLFERFYRVDKARSRKLGGTGLGLAIVRHIALAHGGNVAVASPPGEGSTFTIRLPTVCPN